MSASIATLAHLLESLTEAPESDLIIRSGDTTIRPGYHVTELKHAVVHSVDCGGNTDGWQETVIQLIDGPAVVREGYMTAGKFAGITNKAMAAVPDLGGGDLWFEFAPGNRPHQKLRAVNIEAGGGQIMLDLEAVEALCKPAARARAQQPSANAGAGCCGASKSSGSSSACCAA